ncbi:MAG: DNA-formamidopyrimidine glycosylase family protein [Candidatus Limnocylindrales bacterium]
MPEGDTLFRTAAVLRDILLGRTLVSARGRPGGAQLERLVGGRFLRVESIGKHLLIDVDRGLSLHTHLGLHGSWHRYRTGEPWRRGANRAVAVLEVPGAVAVCFDAPTVDLIETRALGLHPVLRALGPDLVTSEVATDALVGRLRALPPETPVGEALLDQRVMAGLGNVYRSEVCFVERVDPFRTLASLSDPTLAGLVETGRTLIRANRMAPARTTVPGARRPGERLWVYGRAGRPCRRCGGVIQSRVGGDPPRRTWWCLTCQPGASG